MVGEEINHHICFSRGVCLGVYCVELARVNDELVAPHDTCYILPSGSLFRVVFDANQRQMYTTGRI